MIVLVVQYPIKLNGIQDFLGRNFEPPYLHPHACHREKLDGFCNGAAPRFCGTKNESKRTFRSEVRNGVF